MQKLVGVISLVIGVVLVMWGRNIAQSLNSQAHQLVTGSPDSHATYLYIAGAAFGIFGLVQIFWDKK